MDSSQLLISALMLGNQRATAKHQHRPGCELTYTHSFKSTHANTQVAAYICDWAHLNLILFSHAEATRQGRSRSLAVPTAVRLNHRIKLGFTAGSHIKQTLNYNRVFVCLCVECVNYHWNLIFLLSMFYLQHLQGLNCILENNEACWVST